MGVPCLCTWHCAQTLFFRRPHSLLKSSISLSNKSVPVWKVLLLLSWYVFIIYTPAPLIFLIIAFLMCKRSVSQGVLQVSHQLWKSVALWTEKERGKFEWHCCPSLVSHNNRGHQMCSGWEAGSLSVRGQWVLAVSRRVVQGLWYDR